ncbi:MAG: ankyrin repeat domain-containing protein [Alphaproteobacteria bacterium]|nr:ankyrin repeat domain-containing protein [Alphaproteobacteria bacterium]
MPPTGGSLVATAIPEIKAAAKKPKRPTWEDVLKPSYKPKETTFNYRRQVLPPTIYRDSYTNANRHLHVARSGQAYDNIFLLAVARNDVNAVRAMLANGRRDVNLTNAEGDSALIVALRHGALQTARLLLARGADPLMRGAGGLSPYDYAYYWGDTDLMAQLRG